MKAFGTLSEMLLRATLCFPFALALFALVLVYLLTPLELMVYALLISPWYWLTLPVWGASFYLLRHQLRAYFKDMGESWF